MGFHWGWIKNIVPLPYLGNVLFINPAYILGNAIFIYPTSFIQSFSRLILIIIYWKNLGRVTLFIASFNWCDDFHQSRLNLHGIFSSIPLQISKWFSSIPLPLTQCFFINSASTFTEIFHQFRCHVHGNIFCNSASIYMVIFSSIPLPMILWYFHRYSLITSI